MSAQTPPTTPKSTTGQWVSPELQAAFNFIDALHARTPQESDLYDAITFAMTSVENLDVLLEKEAAA